MRIIGGKAGGRVLRAPKGLPARPTTDRTKEAVFNLLENRIEWTNTRVLDLFAGIGSISMECASRGAQKVVAVEKNPHCHSFIRRSAERLELLQLKAVRMDIRNYLRRAQEQYQLIFADPPYQLHWARDLWEMIRSSGLLSEGGIFILEHAKNVQPEGIEDAIEQRQYGQSTISIFIEKGDK